MFTFPLPAQLKSRRRHRGIHLAHSLAQGSAVTSKPEDLSGNGSDINGYNTIMSLSTVCARVQALSLPM